MEQIEFGRAKLTWLAGGVTHLDGGSMFGVVPKALWSKAYPSQADNRVKLVSDPILLEVDQTYYLIDSGLGINKFTEKQKRNFGIIEAQFIEISLASLGLSIDDLDGIIMTHLHYDHANGLTNRIAEDEYESAFPGIPIYVSEIEWEEMRSPNDRSINAYWKKNWEPIVDQVHTFKDELQLSSNIRMVHTGGHSAGHSILIYEDGEDCLIHLGDLLPTLAHLNKLWITAYDDYPITSINEKEKWLAYGFEREAWFTFYHDAFVRAVRFNSQGEEIERIGSSLSLQQV